MAAATNVRAGGLVTSTAAEIQLNLIEPQTQPNQEVMVEWVSGSVQFGVYEDTVAFVPQIDSSQATLSAAGDKFIFTINSEFRLRCKGVGTFRISY